MYRRVGELLRVAERNHTKGEKLMKDDRAVNVGGGVQIWGREIWDPERPL